MRVAPDLTCLRIPCALRRDRQAGPGGKHSQCLDAEIGGHANQIADVNQLTLALFRHRIAEVVVGGNGIDFNARVRRLQPKLFTPPARHVERAAVRPLAVDLHTLIAVFAGATDQLVERQCAPSIPHAKVGDAV